MGVSHRRQAYLLRTFFDREHVGWVIELLADIFADTLKLATIGTIDFFWLVADHGAREQRWQRRTLRFLTRLGGASRGLTAFSSASIAAGLTLCKKGLNATGKGSNRRRCWFGVGELAKPTNLATNQYAQSSQYKAPSEPPDLAQHPQHYHGSVD